jgi:hypothetical protein
MTPQQTVSLDAIAMLLDRLDPHPGEPCTVAGCRHVEHPPAAGAAPVLPLAA